MSRIGKQPVTLPSGVEPHVKEGIVSVKGPKGVLVHTLHPRVRVSHEGNALIVSVEDPEAKQDRALWGLTQRLISNMVQGVTAGFEKKLEVNGVGFRIQLSGRMLTLHLGFSHPIEWHIPEDIEVKVEKNVITVSGIDKQHVGEAAASIRQLKKPEPYKGKGIKYADEVLRRKAGKAAKAGSK